MWWRNDEKVAAAWRKKHKRPREYTDRLGIIVAAALDMVKVNLCCAQLSLTLPQVDMKQVTPGSPAAFTFIPYGGVEPPRATFWVGYTMVPPSFAFFLSLS